MSLLRNIASDEIEMDRSIRGHRDLAVEKRVKR